MDAIRAIWKYGRFFIGSAVVVGAIPILIIGGPIVKWYAILVGIAAVGSELLTKRYEEEPEYAHPGIFYALQYASQIAGILLIITFAWMLGLPHDLFGIGAATSTLIGFDVIANHMANDTWGVVLSAGILAGIAGALGSIAIGHELTHRTENPVAVFMGRLGEAFSLFTHFSIRHPYGHHNLVCTPADPATAFRGENFYHFFIRSIIGQKKMTWDLEAMRLRRIGKSPWNWDNRALRWWGIEVLVVLFFVYAAGWAGLFGILGVSLVTHIGLELANYIEHYGLVRLPDEPMQVRHAWNSNQTAAYCMTVAISRHSHHHADASVEFWDLKAYPDQAPLTLYGYVVSMLICLIPPLWNELMAPRLLDWDHNMASESERRIAMEQNLRSGIPALVDAAERYFRDHPRPTETSGLKEQPQTMAM